MCCIWHIYIYKYTYVSFIYWYVLHTLFLMYIYGYGTSLQHVSSFESHTKNRRTSMTSLLATTSTMPFLSRSDDLWMEGNQKASMISITIDKAWWHWPTNLRHMDILCITKKIWQTCKTCNKLMVILWLISHVWCVV